MGNPLLPIGSNLENQFPDSPPVSMQHIHHSQMALCHFQTAFVQQVAHDVVPASLLLRIQTVQRCCDPTNAAPGPVPA